MKNRSFCNEIATGCNVMKVWLSITEVASWHKNMESLLWYNLHHDVTLQKM